MHSAEIIVIGGLQALLFVVITVPNTLQLLTSIDFIW